MRLNGFKRNIKVFFKLYNIIKLKKKLFKEVIIDSKLQIVLDEKWLSDWNYKSCIPTDQNM